MNTTTKHLTTIRNSYYKFNNDNFFEYGKNR